uniref:Uncharacterized protein n=1 Tax=Parascaris equorum TaxID=6256 RepID=A0A914RW06_PAREQ
MTPADYKNQRYSYAITANGIRFGSLKNVAAFAKIQINSERQTRLFD